MATVENITRSIYEMGVRDNMSAGATAAAAAMKKATEAVVENETAVTRSTRTAQTWVNKTDEVTKAQIALTKAQRDLANAQREYATATGASAPAADAQARSIAALEAKVQSAREKVVALTAAYGPASSGTANVGAAMATSAAHAERLANNTRLTSQQIAALTPQINDLAVQMASGQGLFMPLIQQGPQITQIFGGIGATLRAFASALGPIGIGAAAATVAVGSMLSAFNSQEGVLSDLRAQFRGISGDYRSIAQDAEDAARRIAASSPGISRAEARDSYSYLRRSAAGADFSFSSQQLEDLVRLSSDLARVQGTDLTEATRKLGTSMQSLSGFVEELVRSDMPGFDQALRRQVEDLVASNHQAEAYGLVMERLRTRINEAARDVSPLSAATQQLRTEWERFTQTVGPFLAGAGAGLLSWLANAAQGARTAAEAFERMSGGARLNPFWAFGLGGPAVLPPSSTPTPGGTTPGATGDLRGYIGDASRISGVSEDLIRIIQRMEGRQNRDGSWVVSDQGAVGPMQVLPGTYAGLQQRYGISGDVTNERSNVIAGALYLREMIDRYGGDLQRGITAYHSGPGNVDSGNVGPRGRAYWSQFEGQWVNGNPAITGPVNRDLIAQGVTVQAQRATVDVPPGGQVRAAGGGSGLTPSSIADPLDRAQRIARGEIAPYAPGSSTTQQQEGLARSLREVEEAMRGIDSANPSFDLLTEGARRLREQLFATVTPAESLQRQLQQQGATAGIADEAQRRYTQGLNEFADAHRRAGRAINPVELERYAATLRDQINSALNVNIELTNRATTAQGRIAQAYLQGAEAGQRQELVERARSEVMGSSVLSTEESTAAINRRVAVLERERRATADNTSAQQAARNAREMETQAIERSAIGRGNAGVIDLAEARERLAIRNRGGDPNSDASRADLLSTRQLAEAQLNTRQLQNSWNDLASVGERAFDRIGEAITQGLTQGKISMVSLANIGKAVVSEIIQAFFKLSILNPLLNEIFGGTRGTAGGLWSIISGMISGRSSGGVGGDGSPSGGGWTGWSGGDGSISGGGWTGSAMGNVFAGGNVIPFAAGGLVDRATVVPMAMMGEAGPEAIIPLKRRSDGKLGVASDGGGGGGHTINQTITIDARGADAGVEQKIRAGIAIAVAESNRRLLADIERGGRTAQIVGRRR